MADIIHKPAKSEFKRMAAQLGYEQVVRCRDCKYSYEDIDGLTCVYGPCGLHCAGGLLLQVRRKEYRNMKKLIEKLRLWLIRRLNAVPMDEHTELCREGISLLQRLERQEAEQKRLTERFRYAVREICRRSENTYYDWCCDVCCMRGENCRANGWCSSF